MKILVAALLVLLCTMTLCSQETKNTTARTDPDITPTSCCFSFISKTIPRKSVTGYHLTSRFCSQPGVVFQTKRGRKICADPTRTWVQDYITALKLQA